MGRFLFIIVLLLLLFGFGWLCGDRYGTATWISDVTGPAFDAAEAKVAEWTGQSTDESEKSGDKTGETAPTSDTTEPPSTDESLTETPSDETSSDTNEISEPETGAAVDENESVDDGAALEEDKGQEPEETVTDTEQESTAEDLTDTTANESGEAETASLEPGVMRINTAGLEFIERTEGLRLKAYSGEDNTYIGYGHLVQPGDPTVVTKSEAEQILREDLRGFEDAVRSVITQPMNENEFSAMVTLAFGIGSGNFADSTVVKKFNAGDKQGAADAFLLWNKVGGQVDERLSGLRQEQRAMFLKEPS